MWPAYVWFQATLKTEVHSPPRPLSHHPLLPHHWSSPLHRCHPQHFHLSHLIPLLPPERESTPVSQRVYNPPKRGVYCEAVVLSTNSECSLKTWLTRLKFTKNLSALVDKSFHLIFTVNECCCFTATFHHLRVSMTNDAHIN